MANFENQARLVECEVWIENDVMIGVRIKNFTVIDLQDVSSFYELLKISGTTWKRSLDR